MRLSFCFKIFTVKNHRARNLTSSAIHLSMILQICFFGNLKLNLFWYIDLVMFQISNIYPYTYSWTKEKLNWYMKYSFFSLVTRKKFSHQFSSSSRVALTIIAQRAFRSIHMWAIPTFHLFLCIILPLTQIVLK